MTTATESPTITEIGITMNPDYHWGDADSIHAQFWQVVDHDATLDRFADILSREVHRAYPKVRVVVEWHSVYDTGIYCGFAEPGLTAEMARVEEDVRDYVLDLIGRAYAGEFGDHWVTRRIPKIRRSTCNHCGVALSERPPVYAGRETVTRAWDGNSARVYHTWTCGLCDGLIRQEVGR